MAVVALCDPEAAVAQQVRWALWFGAARREAVTLLLSSERLEMATAQARANGTSVEIEKRFDRMGNRVAVSAAKGSAGIARMAQMSGRSRFVLQNTANQLGDIAVQMQGGTSAARVFGQQMPQLLGGFGALGGMLGVVAPLLEEGEPKSEKISNPATNAAPVAETPVVEASAPKPVAAKPRLAEDVIKNVLYAQAAAWNDGDLNAFMNGYWKNDNVRFISGGSVSKGWNQALKQYKDRYGEGASLGRLSFENLEVQMVDDEVGLVIGRYVLTRNGETDNGVFSLVMKRFDGVWRIVADHSTAAPTVTQ